MDLIKDEVITSFIKKNNEKLESIYKEIEFKYLDERKASYKLTQEQLKKLSIKKGEEDNSTNQNNSQQSQ